MSAPDTSTIGKFYSMRTRLISVSQSWYPLTKISFVPHTSHSYSFKKMETRERKDERMLLLQPHLVLLQSNHLRPHPIRHRPTNRGKFLQSNCQPIGEIEPIPPHRIHPRQTIRILPVKTILHRILPTIHVQIATRLRLQIQRSIRDRI